MISSAVSPLFDRESNAQQKILVESSTDQHQYGKVASIVTARQETEKTQPRKFTREHMEQKSSCSARKN